MFDPNRKLINILAHKYLTNEISKKISTEDDDRSEDASEIAYKILEHPTVRKKIDTVVRKADNLEGTVFSQVRHDTIGAIPAEIGEVINVGLDLVGDTFRTGIEGVDTISLERELQSSLNNLPKTRGGTRKKFKRHKKSKKSKRHKKSKKSKRHKKSKRNKKSKQY
mgnify:CR=1 FL=1